MYAPMRRLYSVIDQVHFLFSHLLFGGEYKQVRKCVPDWPVSQWCTGCMYWMCNSMQHLLNHSHNLHFLSEFPTAAPVWVCAELPWRLLSPEQSVQSMQCQLFYMHILLCMSDLQTQLLLVQRQLLGYMSIHSSCYYYRILHCMLRYQLSGLQLFRPMFKLQLSHSITVWSLFDFVSCQLHKQ